MHINNRYFCGEIRKKIQYFLFEKSTLSRDYVTVWENHITQHVSGFTPFAQALFCPNASGNKSIVDAA